MPHRMNGYYRSLLAVVLAGGRGSRLRVLTEERCKPEMPFGKNRIIDFTLANVINSRIIDRIMFLTQYKQQGLITHLEGFDLNSRMWQKSAFVVPAQQQMGDMWYTGTANAVYQNTSYIKNDPAETIAILSADHIFKLDIRQMLDFHRSKDAKFTVCGMVMPVEDAAGNFGVMELDQNSRIVGFEEKPKAPKELPGRPGMCFASMGIYLVEKKFLLDVLEADHADEASKHDFGNDIIPKLIQNGADLFGYDFTTNEIPGETIIEGGVERRVIYWRDVGRIGAYWVALMDLVAVVPQLNLYNFDWPIPTAWDMLPPAKFVTPDQGKFFSEFGHLPPEMRYCTNFITSGGCIFDTPVRLVDAVIGRSVRTEYGADIEKSVVLDGAHIGEKAKLRFTIVEEGVRIPSGIVIGENIEMDRQNGIYIEKDEDRDPKAWYPPIRVVTKNAHFGDR